MEKKDRWKDKLTPEQYKILRKSGTEPAFSGELLHNRENGKYVCAACGNVLFHSKTKFDSSSGWPSFWDIAKQGAVEFEEDNNHETKRIEVKCAKCGSHLGHVFDDAPKTPTGKRYCINSISLKFKKKNI